VADTGSSGLTSATLTRATVFESPGSGFSLVPLSLSSGAKEVGTGDGEGVGSVEGVGGDGVGDDEGVGDGEGVGSVVVPVVLSATFRVTVMVVPPTTTLVPVPIPVPPPPP
jgi:hypothetical protein